MNPPEEGLTPGPPDAPQPVGRRRLGRLLAAVAVVIALALAGGHWLASRAAHPPLRAAEGTGPTLPRAELEARSEALAKKLKALAPQGIHLVIDTGANRMYLRKGGEVLREAVVSCGSGSVLRSPSGDREWIFDTPRGEFKVESKIKKPIWIKPDWAFVEEGKQPPAKNAAERAERGVLGDYALGIGKGYFIHGTLYTRMLGRNVSHGCVRVGDEDLKAVYEAAPIGAKVFLF